MAMNEDTLLGKLTKIVTDRIVGSMAERLSKLGQRIRQDINGGTGTPGLIQRIASRTTQRIASKASSAKDSLDAAIMKASNWIATAPQQMRRRLTMPGAGRNGPLGTPRARRLRTRRVRALMWGRAKQAWNQIKATHVARRNIAKQQRAGTLPYDRGYMEKQSLRSIVFGEQSRQNRELWSGRIQRLAQRTGLDYFAKRGNRTRAAKLVKRAKIRVNNARRRIFKAGSKATPQMKANLAAASSRLAQAQGLLGKTTAAASMSLTALARTGAAAVTALHTFPYAMKAIAASRVESFRGPSQFSGRLMSAMARYDLQDRQLQIRGAVNTSGSANATINSTMALKESLQQPLEDLSTTTNALVSLGTDIAAGITVIMTEWNPLMMGLHKFAGKIESNTAKGKDKEVSAMDFFRTANQGNKDGAFMKPLPPIK